MNTAIVTTTINIPRLLTAYAANARRNGHSDISFVVIGDRKSPAETAAFCGNLTAEYPAYRFEYLDIPQQQAYLGRFPALWEHLRFDSIQRRNIGLVRAWELGADLIITIDDDNFVLEGDFIGQHARAGQVCELPGFHSSTGWFNVCHGLAADDGAGGAVPFYHRGYPWPLRWLDHEATVTRTAERRRVAVNAGFWLDNPDIDAVARMDRQPIVHGFAADAVQHFCLAPGTWSPFNSQNTALMRQVLPAYFLSPYWGRYDDIWASYVVDRIAGHLGDVIAFGSPMVRQERNPHDLWRDVDQERDGMIRTPDFCAALRSLELRGTSYHACFGEIAARLAAAWPEGAKWSESQREGRRRLLEGLAIWHQVFETLGAGTHAPRAAANM